MIRILLFVSLIPNVLSAACGPVNNTDQAPYFYQCATGQPIVFTKVAVVDDKGNVNYPIDFSKTVVLQIFSNYTGSQTIQSLDNKADISVYKPFFSHCQWQSIPTFGLLDHMRECSNCPFTTGPQQLDFKVDAELFAPIIKILGSGVPTEVEVHVRNGADDTELGCLILQVMFK